ncbi:uncharacterized protein LOC120513823 [Passer montanus]|uniref:uncharacterized protein LOC120513823 n=1 Tax=Passer montanus TaxID=9160 RepID=UPI00196160C5|nr:uncharacterized protein LOC120513823 [Passer montanus]
MAFLFSRSCEVLGAGWVKLRQPPRALVWLPCRDSSVHNRTIVCLTPRSGAPPVPRLGPPALCRAPLAVSDRPEEESRSALRLQPGRAWHGAAPGRALGLFQSTGHRGAIPLHLGTIPVQRAPWAAVRHRGKGAATGAAAPAGDSAKMSKRKPTPEEEPKEETISDEESGEETTPSDESKKKINSDEESRDKPKDGDGPGDDPGNGPDNGSDDGPKDGDNPGKVQGKFRLDIRKTNLH